MVQAESGNEAADIGDGAVSDEVTIDFTIEGLVVLCEVADLPGLPGLAPDPLEGLGEEARDAVLDAARRSLVARRMLRPDGEALALDPAVRAFLEVASTPGIVVRAVHAAEGRIETRFVSAVPDVAIEHSVILGSIQRFTPFPTDALLARVLGFLELAERPDIEAEPFDVTAADLERVAESLAAGDRAGARKALADAGAPDSSAERFIDALGSRRSSSSVTILHRPGEDHIAGGELTWIDAGDAGLWLTPLPDVSDADDAGASGIEGRGDRAADDLDAVAARIEPTGAAAIAAELLSYLPGGDPAA